MTTREHICSFFIIRDISVSLILATLFDHPFTQAALILILNITMIIYHVARRPLKEIIDQIQEFFCEMVMLGMNMSVMIMAYIDHINQTNVSNTEQFSNFVILINFIFNFSIFILLVLKILLNIRKIYHHRKLLKSHKVNPMLQIHPLRVFSNGTGPEQNSISTNLNVPNTTNVRMLGHIDKEVHTSVIE